MHHSVYVIPREVPRPQQPIRGYAGYAQPVGLETKHWRASLPVSSGLSQRKESSYEQKGEEKTRNNPELTVKKEKRVGELTGWMFGAERLTEREKSRRLNTRLPSGEPLRGQRPASSAEIHRATVRNVLFSCSGAISLLFPLC